MVPKCLSFSSSSPRTPLSLPISSCFAPCHRFTLPLSSSLWHDVQIRIFAEVESFYVLSLSDRIRRVSSPSSALLSDPAVRFHLDFLLNERKRWYSIFVGAIMTWPWGPRQCILLYRPYSIALPFFSQSNRLLNKICSFFVSLPFDFVPAYL